jgi:Toxin PAAR-like domain
MRNRIQFALACAAAAGFSGLADAGGQQNAPMSGQQNAPMSGQQNAPMDGAANPGAGGAANAGAGGAASAAAGGASAAAGGAGAAAGGSAAAGGAGAAAGGSAAAGGAGAAAGGSAAAGGEKTGGGGAQAPVSVAKTPSGPAPVPIPYPNVAIKDPDARKNAKGSPAPTKNASAIKKSTGDEAGARRGVVSGMKTDKVEFKQGSPRVKSEGKPVLMLTPLDSHNDTGPILPPGTPIAPGQSNAIVAPGLPGAGKGDVSSLEQRVTEPVPAKPGVAPDTPLRPISPGTVPGPVVLQPAAPLAPIAQPTLAPAPLPVMLEPIKAPTPVLLVPAVQPKPITTLQPLPVLTR